MDFTVESITSENVTPRRPINHARLIAAALVAVAGCFAGCANANVSTNAAGTPAPAREPRSPAAPGPTAGSPSLFAHPWSWTDERGQPVTFAHWRGQPLVVTAMFTQCKATCPRTLAKLRKLYDESQRAGQPAQFLLVTLDPANDTPPALLRFKASSGLPDAWHLLSGSLDDTRDLRDLLGIHVLDDGPHLLHDGRIVVFDGAGRAARAFEGWALDDEVRL